MCGRRARDRAAAEGAGAGLGRAAGAGGRARRQAAAVARLPAVPRQGRRGGGLDQVRPHTLLVSYIPFTDLLLTIFLYSLNSFPLQNFA